MTEIDVLFTPADFEALRARDLGGVTCVVFDVLRATTTMLTALAHGAQGIRPVATIAEAVACRSTDPSVLLAGEREGFRIRRGAESPVDFDLGNSPREFDSSRVRGRGIVMTTTNGTRALDACRRAGEVLIGGIINRRALAAHLRSRRPDSVLLVCAGTHHQAAFEDALGAGAVLAAVADLLPPPGPRCGDGVLLARCAFERFKDSLPLAVRRARNGARLETIPELEADLGVCMALDTCEVVAQMEADGIIRRIAGEAGRVEGVPGIGSRL